jgi:F-type H+-transporting ATPase subunit epsilon
MAWLRCVVVTPEKAVLEQEASFVAVPLYDGELGVAPGRTPLIGRLGYGELRLRDNGRVTRLYVEGGFVEVAGNVVSVLTRRAIPASEIDAAALEESVRDAVRRPVTSPEAMDARDRLLTQARAQLRVARPPE